MTTTSATYDNRNQEKEVNIRFPLHSLQQNNIENERITENLL